MPTKSNLLTLAMIIIIASTVDASQRKRATRDANAPLPDLAFDSWVTYKSVEGRFTTLFPNDPKVGPGDEDDTLGNLKMRYATYESSIKYSVMCIDYPENLESPIVAKDVFDRARDAGITASDEAAQRPRLLRETESTLEGHPARVLQIAMVGGKTTWCKFVVVRNKFYFLEVVLPHPRSPAASKNYEKIARFFLNSFQFIREVA